MTTAEEIALNHFRRAVRRRRRLRMMVFDPKRRPKTLEAALRRPAAVLYVELHGEVLRLMEIIRAIRAEER